MVAEHRDECDSQWAAIQSIAGKIGCTTESLRRWVQQAERERKRPGLRTSDRERLKQLERESRELKRATLEHEVLNRRCFRTHAEARASTTCIADIAPWATVTHQL